ncbi:hypothetical protein A0H81_10006 [Grifola frondosa]|uniref:Uncharacterized protein n=1 Tax=Grifola frondosa TaxID=5627 RepID=A0A1C7M0X7_GRIFR|nr:hypothetical protein A0H81_10006 [Grifola frondosa]
MVIDTENEQSLTQHEPSHPFLSPIVDSSDPNDELEAEQPRAPQIREKKHRSEHHRWQLSLLIYYGVRYLDHNCKDVGHFVNRILDCYAFGYGEYTCGQSKLKKMERGTIFATGDDPLSFAGTPCSCIRWISSLIPYYHGSRVTIMSLMLRDDSDGTRATTQDKLPDGEEDNRYVRVFEDV